MTEENKSTKKSETALREEKILEFWQENETFEKSLAKTEGKKEFVFYEGPPTANGKPGIHHLEARAFKDAIPRYKTMQGYHVRRKGGWDTHGLPVELQVEKRLGLNSKKAIEEYGIAKFNKECKENVWEYLDVWEKFTKRIGFWIDQENPYVTYHNNYIESVWNIIKRINEQNLLYKDYKVVPWCPRCGTVLSSHELAQGYEDVKDLSITAKFSVKDATPAKIGGQGSASGGKVSIEPNTYILAWTTTPWTLPGNLALAVGEDITYVKVKSGNEIFILAKERISILTEAYEVLEEIRGKDLIGLKYEPLFNFYKNTVTESEKIKLEKAYTVYGADFVNTEDGTGVVHTSVMYGQDDFVLGTRVGLPKHHLVGLDGKFLPNTGFLEGRFTRDEETAVEIIKDLAHRGLLFSKEKYTHSYPHCWRCKTALIYYARDSWYIKMSDSKIKKQLIDQNKEINWEPEHIRNGRFGEWLREIKDWAISRERYWGTPLPIWICNKCNKKDVIGSLEELKNKTLKSRNKYFVMRHGGSESNVNKMVSSKVENEDHLTEEGKKQVLDSISELKGKKIDLIISSDFIRTKETAEIVKKGLGLGEDSLIFDKRLWELSGGIFNGKTWGEYYQNCKKEEKYNYKVEGGESYKEVKLRMTSFLYKIEEKYKDKNILIITHRGPAQVLIAGSKGLNDNETARGLIDGIMGLDNAQVVNFPFTPLPHSENFELDLHRPYIDNLSLICAHSTTATAGQASSGQACGGKLIRTKEVMDVWLDSGTMPFSQDHYPFENKKLIEGKGYPADYICEAIDQTRGWFYTLHAIGILMGRGKAYKNVICLGHILDKDGKKMSKSLRNIVEPFEAMDKYGVDTLRLWMYAVNQPGESKNFDEKTVALLHQQVFGLLYNVLAFYELYRDKTLENNNTPKSDFILDKWILARLNELIKLTTENLDNYKLLEPIRALRDFIEDLSTWYLRRSRERIKNGDKEAKQTLYYILKTLAKLMAPFAPFTAEDIWLKLKVSKDVESIHLENWPTSEKTIFSKIFKKEEKVIKEMDMARKIVTLGLEARQKAGIKVRQPLSKIKIKDYNFDEKYFDLIKDELNVKEVVFDNSIADEVELDMEITPELKEEGNYRELIRGLQSMRKEMGLTPNDIVNISFATNDKGKQLIQKFEADMKKTVLISKIEFEENDGEEIKINNLVFKVKIDKI